MLLLVLDLSEILTSSESISVFQSMVVIIIIINNEEACWLCKRVLRNRLLTINIIIKKKYTRIMQLELAAVNAVLGI
jgi:hypothetical protein